MEALTEALRDYPGTVVIVSHDRSFIGRIAHQILEIRDGRAEIYPGTYDDYLWSLEKGSLKDRFSQNIENYAVQKKAATSTPESQPKAEGAKNKTPSLKQLQSEIRDYQKKIKKLEEELDKSSTLVAELNQDLLTARGETVAEISKSLSECAEKVQSTEDQLLEYMELVSAAEQQLAKNK